MSDRIRPWFRRCWEKVLPGHDVPYELASCLYRRGDYVRAREIYEQLAEQDVYARVFLAWMVEGGRGSAPDISRARSLFESAAQGESLYARFHLAKFYMRMEEAEHAFNCMVELTAKGYGPAIYWLGRMFAEGIGTPRDVEQSRYYLEYVAERGHIWAKRYLIRLDLRSGSLLTRARAVAQLGPLLAQAYRIALREPDNVRLIA